MEQQFKAFDVKPIGELAAILQQYGFYAFAAAALIALWIFRSDRVLSLTFLGMFVVAGAISVFLTVNKKPDLALVAGSFGSFARDAEPTATSSDSRFYAAHRFDSNSVDVHWVYFLPDASAISNTDNLKFSFYEKRRKQVLGNNLEPTFETASLGGSFVLPAATYMPTDGKRPPYFNWTRKVIDELGTQKVCFEGTGLAARICGTDSTITSSERPAPHGVRYGGLLYWLFSSAAAQEAERHLAALPTADALKSSDSRNWNEAAKTIAKAPAENAGLINDTLAQPIENNTYTARLAIVSALRGHYQDRGLVWPDSTTMGWLTNASWRRIVLDSFDRADPLGDMSRRLLRVGKSTQSKTVLDATLAQVKAIPGAAEFHRCLDLLQQDIYINWATLSLDNLKAAGRLAKGDIDALASLVEPITLDVPATTTNAFRLRANYIRGALLIEGAAVVSAAERATYEAAGIAALTKVKAAIDALGLATLRPLYYVNPGELNKTVAFFSYMAETNKVSVTPLQGTAVLQNPYPSCKL